MWSRAELSQYPRFTSYSARPGALDRSALRAALEADPVGSLDMLPRLAKAADPALRHVARRLAGQIVLRFAQQSGGTGRGVGRLVPARFEADQDLDLDASTEPLLLAAATRTAVDVGQLVGRRWRRSEVAVSLVVDVSGSMSGSLVTAALATAALAMRAGEDYSVLAVSDRVLVVKAQGGVRSLDAIVDDLFALRSHGWTDLALGLRAAGAELARSGRHRKVTVCVTDGRWNHGGDPQRVARTLDELYVIAPIGNGSACRPIAHAGHGRVVEVGGPHDIVAALRSLLTQ